MKVLSVTQFLSILSISISFTFLSPVNNKKIIYGRERTSLQGLFDGLKDAFSAPALEQSTLKKERETPIDRWMGWNAMGSDETSDTNISGAEENKKLLDSMDASNYFSADLTKPMGIVFEENDEEVGGIFVLSLKDGGVAEQHGSIKPGVQLVAVNDKKVSGLAFDNALSSVTDSQRDIIKLTFFRGTSNQFYGPTGPSQEWLDNFIKETCVLETSD